MSSAETSRFKPSTTAFAAGEPDELATGARLIGWDCDYLALRRSFEARVAGAQVTGAQLLVVDFAVPLIARGEAPADCYVFALMRSGAGESRLGGERLAQSHVGLIRPGRDYEFHTTGRADLLLLAIPRHDAERSAQAIWGRSLEETDGRATIDFEKRDQHPGVVHAWSRVLSDMLASRTPVDDPATTSTLPDGLLVDLLCKVAPQGGRALSRRATAVRGAAFLRQQWRRPLCLRDVCEAVDAPERTLRQGFAEVYACSPMSYLRRIRLRTAREMLLRSEPTERITDVALACGFTHMGSFSVDYRRTYGETPSETRAR